MKPPLAHVHWILQLAGVILNLLLPSFVARAQLPEPGAGGCPPAFEGPVAPFKIPKDWETHHDLEHELAQSGLSPEQLQTMKASSRGVSSIRDFLRVSPEIRFRYRLGLDHFRVTWPALRKVLPGTVNAYREFQIPYVPMEPYTDTLMDKMTGAASAEGQIVFFVPRDVLNHSQRFATADELEWLLRHPDRMSQVHFVFGAYHVLTDEGYALLSSQLRSKEKESDALAELFRGYIFNKNH